MRHVITAAIAVLVLAGCVDPGVSGEAGPVSVAAADQSPPETAPEAAETPAAEAPAETGTFTLGGTGTVSEAGVDVGTVMVESATTRTTSTADYIGEPPANGKYWTVTLVVTALPGQLFEVHPWEFELRTPAGDRYDQLAGNAMFEAGDTDLSPVTLNGGETARGTITYDAPAEAQELIYTPLLSQRTLATWDLVP